MIDWLPFGKLMLIIIKPVARLLASIILIPLCQIFFKRVLGRKYKQRINYELVKDLTLWIRGSIILLIASSNCESYVFGWVPPEWKDDNWWIIFLRLMLAISVVELMPDQALFAIIHPGPPKPPPLRLSKPRVACMLLLKYIPQYLQGTFFLYLNRSSPVLAILTVFFGGWKGWLFYSVAITNYLIIGLLSSIDKALNALRELENAYRQLSRELEEELREADRSMNMAHAVDSHC